MSRSSKNWIKPAVLSLALVSAGGFGVALAKDYARGHGHGHCESRHDGGRMSGKFGPVRHIEGKLAFLKTELGITGDQEQAWQEFAAVFRDNAEKRAEMWQGRREHRKESKDGEKPSLDERVDRRIEGMEQHLAMFRTMAEATKKLYGQLTPEQQELADDMLSRRHGRRFM